MNFLRLIYTTKFIIFLPATSPRRHFIAANLGLQHMYGHTPLAVFLLEATRDTSLQRPSLFSHNIHYSIHYVYVEMYVTPVEYSTCQVMLLHTANSHGSCLQCTE